MMIRRLATVATRLALDEAHGLRVQSLQNLLKSSTRFSCTTAKLTDAFQLNLKNVKQPLDISIQIKSGNFNLTYNPPLANRAMKVEQPVLPTKIIRPAPLSMQEHVLKLPITDIENALGVDSGCIRVLEKPHAGPAEKYISDGVEIIFKPTFANHSKMEEILKKLKSLNIECHYSENLHPSNWIGGPRLTIHGRGLKEFIDNVIHGGNLRNINRITIK